MAMHVSHDQNFSVHFDGIKTYGSAFLKNRGGLRERKALNDISNSGKPLTLHASRKHNSKNVIPIGEEDLGVSKKAQISGRKALGDLTNSVKQFGQQKGLKGRIQEKKLIAEEGFLHDHQECVKSQRTAMAFDQFLKTVGLDEDVSFQFVSSCHPLPRKSKDESPTKLFEIEELSELIAEDKTEFLRSGHSSPKSPKLPYMNMKDYDDFPSFILAKTPKGLD